MAVEKAGNDGSAPYRPVVCCATCALRRVCIPATLNDDAVRRFDAIVRRVESLEAGVDVIRPGDPFRRIHVLRVGHLQEFVTAGEGQRRVAGYAMPSDVLGLDGFAEGRHVVGMRTLETVSLCQLRPRDLAALAADLPQVMEQLQVKFSQHLLAARRLQLVVGRHTARERVAATVLSHAERAGRIRWSTVRLRLPMSQADIAESLGMTPEAMSRTLRQLAQERVLAVQRNEIRILDAQRLWQAANGAAREVPPEVG